MSKAESSGDEEEEEELTEEQKGEIVVDCDFPSFCVCHGLFYIHCVITTC